MVCGAEDARDRCAEALFYGKGGGEMCGGFRVGHTRFSRVGGVVWCLCDCAYQVRSDTCMTEFSASYIRQQMYILYNIELIFHGNTQKLGQRASIQAVILTANALLYWFQPFMRPYYSLASIRNQ